MYVVEGEEELKSKKCITLLLGISFQSSQLLEQTTGNFRQGERREATIASKDGKKTGGDYKSRSDHIRNGFTDGLLSTI